MLDTLFQSILVSDVTTVFSVTGYLICTAVSLGLGVLIAAIYMFRNSYTKGFVVTLVLLPAMIQMVILLVNGNLGAGVAVMGAFSLIRFRSAPGTAREISSIFLAMAVGLATGMGYIAIAVLFAVILGAVSLLLSVSPFGKEKHQMWSLRVTIPESLDYTGVFDDVFEKYLKKWEMVSVKTSNMGSLYKLEYQVVLKHVEEEKQMIDELRRRNGNLEILCCRAASGREELL